MTPSPLALPPTHRPQFFAGEILHAAELEDAVAVERSLRWLHNRALHGWGIGLGLGADGARGATSVTVGEGYALDAAGRDLVLEQPRTLAVPPVASGPDGAPADYLLVLAYTTDETAAVQLRDGACETSGAVRRADDPTVAWRVPQAVREGIDIVLAAAKVAGCALAAPLTGDGVRRRLGAIPSPHVAAGSQSVAWRAWTVAQKTIGVRATVDTSAAGFGDTPAYQVTIIGEREVSASNPPFLVDGHPHVERAGMHTFEVAVPLPPGGAIAAGGADVLAVNPAAKIGDPAQVVALVESLGWSVQWIGVQPH